MLSTYFILVGCLGLALVIIVTLRFWLEKQGRLDPRVIKFSMERFKQKLMARKQADQQSSAWNQQVDAYRETRLQVVDHTRLHHGLSMTLVTCRGQYILVAEKGNQLQTMLIPEPSASENKPSALEKEPSASDNGPSAVKSASLI